MPNISYLCSNLAGYITEAQVQHLKKANKLLMLAKKYPMALNFVNLNAEDPEIVIYTDASVGTQPVKEHEWLT